MIRNPSQQPPPTRLERARKWPLHSLVDPSSVQILGQVDTSSEATHKVTTEKRKKTPIIESVDKKSSSKSSNSTNEEIKAVDAVIREVLQVRSHASAKTFQQPISQLVSLLPFKPFNGAGEKVPVTMLLSPVKQPPAGAFTLGRPFYSPADQPLKPLQVSLLPVRCQFYNLPD